MGAILKMQTFTILSNEIEGRIDPFYYKEEFRDFKKKLEKSKFEIHELGEITKKISDGTHFTPNYFPEGIPFLSVKNIRKNSISFKEIKFISEKEHKKLIKRCDPKENDILLTKVGATYGLSAVIPKNLPEFSIFVSLALIRLKDGFNPHYIMHFLNSPDGYSQMKRFVKGIGQPDLHLEDIKQIKVPIPPLETQNKIVQLMDKAYSSKKLKESEAQKLLDSINDYVLDELGIKLPELKDKMVYVVNSEEVQNKRINAYYYQPKFEEVEKAIKKGKFEVKEIKDALVMLNKLENIENYDYLNYVDLASINKSLGLIKNYSKLKIKEAPSRARQKIEKGDLLLSGLSGSLKSIAIFEGSFDNAICSTGFYVIKNSKNYNNYYLWALFRSEILQMLLQRESSGAIMSSINREALLNFKIPLPPLSVQNKIADEVKNRMQKAEQLQKEAKEDLEKAKQEVERIILNE